MILGVGSPILDYVIPVDYSFFSKDRDSFGGMQVITSKKFDEILKKSSTKLIVTAGGSAANTIKALASIGLTSALFGTIGDDENGSYYRSYIESIGVIPYFQSSKLPTSKALCLITPKGERTCRTFLGASQEIQISNLAPEYLRHTKLVHIEGYSLLQTNLTEEIMKIAKDNNCLVSFDLGSFEIVEHHREKISHLLKKYVDIVFANHDETYALTGFKNDLGCVELQKMCSIAVSMQGENGSFVSDGNYLFFEKTTPVQAIDTTGAGDLFAAGFLAAFLKGQTLDKCARFGNMMGKEAVITLGANLSLKSYEKLKKQLSDL